jgi:magnesium transporter
MKAINRKALILMVRQFFEQDPTLAAHSLETMDEEQAVAVLAALPPTIVSDIFALLQPDLAAKLLQHLPEEQLASLIPRLNAEQGAALFLRLNEEERKHLIQRLPERSRLQIQEMLTYPENSAGRIMSTDFLAFHSDIKVRNAIQRIRLLARKKNTASYAYVVDKENHLVGVINMRDIMLANGDETLESVMRKEVFMVNCFMDREPLAEEFSKRRFFAAPVVDNENRLLGVVKAEQLLDDVQEEATEDLQKMFGAGGDERVFSPISFSLKKRLPWLHVNLATAFLAGSVVALFKDIIGQFPVLAVYLPVVAGQGGNAGAQSLAVVMRGLVMREIPTHKVWGLIFKEAAIGIANGVAIGLLTACAAVLWHGNPYLGLVVGLAMLTNLVIAGLTGSAIPLTMKAIGLDPAQCSNIILTTFTDVMGFLALLGFAVLFKHYLI